LALALAAVSCKDSAGTTGDSNSGGALQTLTYSGTAGGDTYTLVITEKSARYAAKADDTYVLTVGTKKSTGTVSSVSGGALSLKPTNAPTEIFTVTVSSTTGITAITGTITFTDNTKNTNPPGSLTNGSSGSGTTGGTNTGGNSSIPGGTISNQPLDNKAGSNETNFSYYMHWEPNTTHTIQLLSYALNGDSSVTISGGNVNIKLGTPKNEYLEALDMDGIAVVPSNAKVFSIGQFWSSDGKYSLTYMKNDLNGHIGSGLVYADRDVTVTGTETWFNPYEERTETEKYNCALKAGWNYIYTLYDEATITETMTTTKPSGTFKWELNSGGH
jgi:hypothetical protein